MHKYCPQCGSERFHRSRRRDKTELMLSLVGGRLRRCHQCQIRFLMLGPILIRAGKLGWFTKELTLLAVMAAGLLAILSSVPLLTRIP
jgi:hypothetical protein